MKCHTLEAVAAELSGQAERGTIDLDERVVSYLPEFRLTTPAPAERIGVRHLLNHTNGIGADLFFPDAQGRDALKIFVEGLGRHCGTLFQPSQYRSYSNGGMFVAGRLVEAVTGTSYHDLLTREVYAPAGMDDSCTSAEEAILRSTAVGHFPDPATGGARRTGMFKLPDTWAPAGATAIGTVSDLLAFGRIHLAGGVSPSGTRVLSAESAARMQSVPQQMATPSNPPIGLGWLLMPFGHTTVLTHSGASAGGVSLLAVVPGHDLEPQDKQQERIFTAFAGGSTSAPPRRYIPIGEDLFVPAGMPLEAFSGYSRLLLVSYHGAGDGHPAYRCAGGRMTRREHPG